MFQGSKKMPVLMAAAVLFSVWMNWDYLFGDKKKATPHVASAPQTAKQQKKQAGKAKSPQKQAKKKAPAKVPNREKMIALSKGNNWGSNPFGFKPKVKKTNKVQVAPKKVRSTALHLESILITQFQPLAVINNRVLAEGDIFQGRKIVKITEDSVILEAYGTKQELTLKEHSIPMTFVKTSAVDTEQN